MIELGHVVLRSKDPVLVIRALLDEDNPKVTGGYGGWEITPRPRRKALTVWKGVEPLQMTVALIFDRFKAGGSVDEAVANLEKMAQPRADRIPPPIIDIEGAVPHQRVNWVINGITWGETIRSTRRPHHRVRQRVSIDIVEYVKARKLTVKTGLPGENANSVYITKKGDTLKSIAKKLLGDPDRWREIAKLNNLRDPRHLKPGKRLVIPPR